MPRFPILPAADVATAVSSGLVLLDFWQASCAPCRALEPRLEAFARAHRGAFTGYRIDVDTDQQTTSRYAVQSIPTLVWLRDGREIDRLDGLIRDNDLEQSLIAAAHTSPDLGPGRQPGHR